MAIAIRDATGASVNVDTITPSGGSPRQVSLLGSPTTVANVAEVDAAGLQVSTQGRPIAAVTGSITSASSTVTATVSAAGNATITINGTYAGVSYSFLASDDAGTNFYPVQVTREDNGAVLLSDTPGTNAKASYLVDIPGWNQLRVAASAWTSGTANIRISPGGGPFVPVVSIGNRASGTGTVTSVNQTTTADTTLLAANPARTGWVLYNNATAELTFLAASGTQSATVFTGKLGPKGRYVDPFGYTGRVSGSWAAAGSGASAGTEYKN